MFHRTASGDMLSSLSTDARRSPEASSGCRRALLYGANQGPVNSRRCQRAQEGSARPAGRSASLRGAHATALPCLKGVRDHARPADTAAPRAPVPADADLPALATAIVPARTGNGQFHGPGGRAVDSASHISVADAGKKRVQKFAADGTSLQRSPTGRPEALASGNP